MEQIIFKFTKDLDESSVRILYENNGWISYTKHLPRLMKSIESSLMVVSAWDNDNLVGLIRVVGDGFTILYIQDILLLDTYKRKGIGTKLLNYVLDEYKDVRQKVLITDDSEETRGFYEANGFSSCDKGGVVAFAKFE